MVLACCDEAEVVFKYIFAEDIGVYDQLLDIGGAGRGILDDRSDPDVEGGVLKEQLGFFSRATRGEGGLAGSRSTETG